MMIGAIGETKLYSKKVIFNVLVLMLPMTKITLIEDLSMGLMAIFMLIADYKILVS